MKSGLDAKPLFLQVDMLIFVDKAAKACLQKIWELDFTFDHFWQTFGMHKKYKWLKIG